MPADTAFVLTGVLVAFVGFALILAWADHHTHGARKG